MQHRFSPLRFQSLGPCSSYRPLSSRPPISRRAVRPRLQAEKSGGGGGSTGSAGDGHGGSEPWNTTRDLVATLCKRQEEHKKDLDEYLKEQRKENQRIWTFVFWGAAVAAIVLLITAWPLWSRIFDALLKKGDAPTQVELFSTVASVVIPVFAGATLLFDIDNLKSQMGSLEEKMDGVRSSIAALSIQMQSNRAEDFKMMFDAMMSQRR